MQCLHRQTANFIIFKGEDLIGTTQDFSYFVINAVSKQKEKWVLIGNQSKI